MKVIVAGIAKTGTTTIASALNLLGYSTYGYIENQYFLHAQWSKIFKNGGTANDFRRMYTDVDAVVDTPCCYYWEELSQAFPEAKIILTIRDEESWYRSLAHQIDMANSSFIYWIMSNFTLSAFTQHYYSRVRDEYLLTVARWPSRKLKIKDKPYLMKLYREHNFYVQMKAPKDKLLVYKVSEGWEPLCKFLGEEIPNKPFPHENKDGSRAKNMLTTKKNVGRKYVRHALISLGGFALVGSYTLYKCYQLWPFSYTRYVARIHYFIFRHLITGK